MDLFRRIVNGSFDKEAPQPARLLIDTGASVSVIDEHWAASRFPSAPARQVGMQTTGIHGHEGAATKFITLPSLFISGQDTGHREFTSMSLGHVNFAYNAVGVAPVQGLLGSDVLFRINAVVSYAERRMLFSIGS